MPELMTPPPYSAVEPVTDIIHGVAITDPYRWLEEQDSPRTRRWIEEQTRYTHSYLDNIPGRDRIRKRIEELLCVKTYDSLQKVGNRYFFRKREPRQEQPCICMREGPDGEDQVLVNPGTRSRGKYIAVKLLQVSIDGGLLAYEVKQGGERTGSIEILDITRCEKLPDELPRGFLRGFAFAPDNKSLYYVHQPLGAERRRLCTAYCHVLGSDPRQDQEIFFAGEDPAARLGIRFDRNRLGFFVAKVGDTKACAFYLRDFRDSDTPRLVFQIEGALFVPILVGDRILAFTDDNAPNRRIVEVPEDDPKSPNWPDFIPETEARLTGCAITADRIFVSYLRNFRTHIDMYDLAGNKIRELSFLQDQTVRILANHQGCDEFLYERESFTYPPATYRYLPDEDRHLLWSERRVPLDTRAWTPKQVWFSSKDGTSIPMFLVGPTERLNAGLKAVILTGYGGFGASMTPQFSTFVGFLIEQGCLFALANLRGGSELGSEWHQAGKRRNRQKAYEDFIAAAEWLVENGHTIPERLAIFGGSNSGLLVGAALTQRPDLFRAVVCIAPLLDMLRYHLFDFARNWEDEYGTAENQADFDALHSYSPYLQVRPGTSYPAVLIVSGDADRNCNPLHARKMTARLQAANISQNPILLDYKEFRGHSPVLPLSERVEGLTDRLSFVCDQLEIPI